MSYQDPYKISFDLIKRAISHKQKGRCAICERYISEEQAILDHDHEQGTLRGILCGGCNVMVGRFEHGKTLRCSEIRKVQIEHYVRQDRIYWIQPILTNGVYSKYFTTFAEMEQQVIKEQKVKS